MKKVFTFLLLILPFCHFGQYSENTDSIIFNKYKIEPDNPIVASLDSMLNFYNRLSKGIVKDSFDISVIDEVPEFTSDEVKKMLSDLDNNTPFSFNFNPVIEEYIRFYEKRRRSVAIFLARKEAYFPIFEEMLLKYKLPLELKYLPIVESALKPTAESWAGAAGLWQFMYNTGKQYGLEANSYVDLRKDPYKATEAACKHLKKLYKVYKNWELVLAAYNAGGGNVNKAIRRSGGKKDYWEIYEFLPKETRGYVPAFIAVNFMMNYAPNYNIQALDPLAKYSEIDTLHVSKRVDLAVVSRFFNIPFEYLQYLNPSFYLGIIPQNETSNYLYLPKDKIGEFTTNQHSIFSLSEEIASLQSIDLIKYENEDGRKINYRVKKGDHLSKIARN